MLWLLPPYFSELVPADSNPQLEISHATWWTCENKTVIPEHQLPPEEGPLNAPDCIPITSIKSRHFTQRVTLV